MPTGVRVAMVEGKGVAKGLGKGMAKGLAKGMRHFAVAPILDASLDASLEEIRGFAVRPQHLERYRRYVPVYRAEEFERSNCWKQFLHTYSNPGDTEGDPGIGTDVAEPAIDDGESYWGSLWAVEQALESRKFVDRERGTEALETGDDEDEDEIPDVEKRDSVQDNEFLDANGVCPWAEELKTLVWGGVPAALRGELWQLFAGAKERWVDGYYQALLRQGGEEVKDIDMRRSPSVKSFENNLPPFKSRTLEKWASQIEKDLPRTFPGHPLLGKDRLDALRRMLTAYARHNPDVGYCQAMNFLAALLLLLMPEENAFWTLSSIIDHYFEGYYTEKMSEAQVDQLVFSELVREQFPKLATHLKTLDVEVSWFSGAWFLSIFVNVIPWESVLRVWDVLLFEGNRSMLFRTALALLEMHAGVLVQQRDSGDVLAMMQSMGETTFDSSQLVLSACLGFQAIDEKRLQKLRNRHRPAVIASLHQRSMELRQWRMTNAMAKQETLETSDCSISVVAPSNIAEDNGRNTLEPTLSAFKCGLNSRIDEGDEYEETQSLDLQEEVSRLRTELYQEHQARKAAECRAEELESAFMEMVKLDNRRQLSVEVEKLEAQVAHLKNALADKHEQEAATVQVLVRLEQERSMAEDARQRTEEEAEASRQIAKEALRRATLALEEMEKRAVMAESMLEATLHFHADSVPQPRRGIDPKLKGDELKDNPRFRNHPIPKQDGDSEQEKRPSASKLEEAEDSTGFVASILDRPFPWRDKSKVHVERKLEAGGSPSVSVNSSPVPFRKVGNIQLNANAPEVVKLQYIKRRL